MGNETNTRRKASFSRGSWWESELYEARFFLREWTERRHQKTQLDLAEAMGRLGKLSLEADSLRPLSQRLHEHFERQRNAHGDKESEWEAFDFKSLNVTEKREAERFVKDGDSDETAQIAPWITRFLEHITRVNLEMSAIEDDEIRPVWIKRAVARIEGVEVDGEIVRDVETLLDTAPDDMLDELRQEIRRRALLGEDVKKKFESPSTSASPEAGDNSSLSASSVSA